MASLNYIEPEPRHSSIKRHICIARSRPLYLHPPRPQTHKTWPRFSPVRFRCRYTFLFSIEKEKQKSRPGIEPGAASDSQDES